MRIIGGRWKGRRLSAVPAGVRPTSDSLRETLFNVLADACAGSVWLDGFAGSGAVGFEALSRGARRVYFCERDPAAIDLIRSNADRCSADAASWTLFAVDIFRLLKTFDDEPPRVLFFDPPYRFRQYGRLLSRLVDSPLLSPPATVVLEHFKKTPLDFVPAGLTVSRALGSGDSRLLLLTSA